MSDFVVTEIPRRHGRTLLQADTLALALDFVDRHVGRPPTRLVLWWPDPPFAPGTDADVMIAVPLGVFMEVRALAEGLIEARALSAREELVGAVAAALPSAAVTGPEESIDHVGL